MRLNDHEYNLENVNNRLELLLDVLRFDSECKEKGKQGYLSYYQRILINRERSALMSFKNYLFREIKHSEILWYQVPNEVELLITEITNKINN